MRPNFLVILLIFSVTGISPPTAAGSAVPPVPFGGAAEVATVFVDDDWRRVTFSSSLTDPIVVAGPASIDGDSDPGTLRVGNVTASGFRIRFEEWTYLDRTHDEEHVSYVAAERGVRQLPSGALVEAGDVVVPDGFTWVSVSLEGTFVLPPILLVSVSSSNVGDPVVARVRNVTTTGFQVRLQEEESGGQHVGETVSYVAWSAGSDDGTADGISWESGRVDVGVSPTPLPQTMALDTPCLAAAMNSVNGGDPADLRRTALPDDDIGLFVQEEQSADVETSHVDETVGFLLTECESRTELLPPPMEVGAATMDGSWRTIPLSSAISDPVVVAGPAGMVDADPGTVRIDDVTPTAFRARFEEWDYLDGPHASEQVTYLAAQRGTHVLPSGASLEAGTATVPNASEWVTVSFEDPFTAAPVVLVSITSTNGSNTLVARTRAVTDTGFQVRMQTEEATTGAQPAETVSYVAWSAGADTTGADGVPWEAGTATIGTSETAVEFATPFESPCVIASLSSWNGSNPAALRLASLADTNAGLLVQEEQSADAETGHLDETIGYLVATCDSTLADSRMALATNLAQFSQNSEWAFIDIFRMSRPWISGSIAPYVFNDGRVLDLDEQGWVRSLSPGQVARTQMLGTNLPVRPAGRYIVRYEGTGELSYGGGARLVARSPGRDVIEVPTDGMILLNLVETDSADYLRDIRVVMPGGVYADDPLTVVYEPDPGRSDYLPFEEHFESLVFHPDFLASLEGYETLRFMNWMRTNTTQQRTWSERPTREHAQWTIDGPPLEVMIDLANRAGIDPWFNIPHLADDDYVQQFAAVVAALLDPSLHPHVEYSNEVLNTQFPQYVYARDRGFALGLDTTAQLAAAKFYALRTTQIFEIWEQVFGGGDGFAAVTVSKATVSWMSDLILDYGDTAAHTDVLSVAGYFGMESQQVENCEAISGMTIPEMFDFVYTESLPRLYNRLAPHLAAARTRGLKLYLYEAGQHYRYNSCGGDAAQAAQVSALFDGINHDPEMKDVYLEALTTLDELGVDLFAHYHNTGTQDNFGSRDHLLQARDEAPKYDALMEYSEG